MAQKASSIKLKERKDKDPSKHVGNNVNSLIFFIEKLTQCELCNNRIQDPRMLACQHTFCCDCLTSHFYKVRSLKTKSECPKCQLPIMGAKESIETFVEYLPKNVYISALLAELLKHEIKFDVQLAHVKKCEGCKKPIDERLYRDHFCNHCRQVFCDPCWADHFASLLQKFSSFDDDLDELENNLRYNCEELLAQCNKTASKITAATEVKIREIRAKETSCLETVSKLKNQQKITAKALQQRIIDTKIKMQAINDNKSKVYAFGNMSNEIYGLSNDIAGLKSTQLHFDKNTFKLEQVESIADQVDHNIMLIKSEEDAKSYYMNKIFKPKLIWNKCPRPAGLGIPPWALDLLYLAVIDNSAIMVIKRHNFEVVGMLSHPEMLKPHALAFCGHRMEVYVADKWKHCIHVFSARTDTYVKTIRLQMGVNNNVQNPGGLAVDQQNRLVVCSTANDTVLFVDPDSGNITGCLGMIDEMTTQLQVPTKVVTYKDVIIVADAGNYRIKVFTLHGLNISDFGSMGKGRGQFMSIDAIACDPTGLVFVGDSINERIQVFQQDGSLIKTFPSYGKRAGKASCISDILITPQFEIIVTDYKNKQLLLI